MLLILPVTVLVAEMIGRQASLYTAGHETYLIHYSQSRGNSQGNDHHSILSKFYAKIFAVAISS
jgi:hypothetical protein